MDTSSPSTDCLPTAANLQRAKRWVWNCLDIPIFDEVPFIILRTGRGHGFWLFQLLRTLELQVYRGEIAVDTQRKIYFLILLN